MLNERCRFPPTVYTQGSLESSVFPHPLLIQFHQLLSDFWCVECQAQAVHIELRHKVLQHFFEGQPSS